MEPMKPMSAAEKWWPGDLGEPSTIGSQNELRYAFFADKHRRTTVFGAASRFADADQPAIRARLSIARTAASGFLRSSPIVT